MKTFTKHFSIGIILCLLFVTFPSAKKSKGCKHKLASVHIVDRNGFSETISSKERLNQFQNVNFLSSQPYQKVLRIFARDVQGNIRSVVTTYFENGNPKQFLEILNGRAYGTYCEWHENGKMSLNTTVIGGSPDVTAAAEKTWLFDGQSNAWDEEGHQIAAIFYNQGVLEGVSIYFHPNGAIWKRVPYTKNQINGIVEIYKCDGELLQQMSYYQGIRNGPSVRYWICNQVAGKEEFCSDKLENGQYFDKEGCLIAEVKNGTGFRAIFTKDGIQEVQEHINGNIEGIVKVFNQQGGLKRIYHVKNGIKHGEEIEYYDLPLTSQAPLQAKLSFYWYEGKVQGIAKTWYPNGSPESQKEMANNAKNGVLTAWYRDGNMMLIEEYDNDKLIRGDYFKKEGRVPVSQVVDGKGIVTIFDADGHFVQKITYANGKPEISS